MTTSVSSLKHLKRLRLKLKHAEVQITKAGSHYKARWPGVSNFVFGPTEKDARERLLKTPSQCVTNDPQNSQVRANRHRGNDKQ
jgi:hypothetical protein